MRKVFVSSTSEDLIPYRQAAKDVVLDLGWHPVMMEHFGADGSSGTVEACARRVKESDLVLAILGWRSGWIPGPELGGDGRRSITQIEIDTAKGLAKPIVAFLARDDWPGKLWDSDRDARKQVEALRGGLDRLALFFGWEPVEVGAAETLPQFRAKVRQELLRYLQTPTAPNEAPPPIPHYPNSEVRALSVALEEAHGREESTLSEGGDPSAIRREILDLRRRIREGGNVKAGDLLSGRFKLIELLGNGGFATVWKAFDRRDRILVAVKVLHPQYARDSTRLERFFRGARKMAELHHPGIVRVFEKRLDEGGYHFFVMEYVEGGDLRAAVLRNRLPAERIVPLIREVAEALQVAHDNGVVHRDIKPANILLDLDGRAKLSDFDLVRAADTTGGTIGGGLLGTFLYTAPECMSAPQDAGVEADVYSLAMTAAFCFHRKDLSFDVIHDARGFFDRLPCSVAIRDALHGGAMWEVSQRYQSAAAFSAAIELATRAPLAVVPESPRESAAERSKQPKAKVSTGTLMSFLEHEVVNFPEVRRSEVVLEAVEHALPLHPESLETLGIVAWAVDYFVRRSDSRSNQEAGLALVDKAFGPLRERTPPPMPGSDDHEWAAIPGGVFQMGSSQGFHIERPPHSVTILPFRLGIHPVTAAEYARLNSKFREVNDLPATRINWYSAYAFAAWLGGRLPTEAEWEYAARGGTMHAFTNRRGRPTTLGKVGWYSENSGRKCHLVCQLEPNPWGLYDMIGNVWEWVADWFDEYSGLSQSNAWGPPTGKRRVVRGGSAWSDEEGSRVTYRHLVNPNFGGALQGFRVALPGLQDLLRATPVLLRGEPDD